MSTTLLTDPTVVHVRRSLALMVIMIVILTSLTLIAIAMLSRPSTTTHDDYQADLIPVVQHPVSPFSAQLGSTATS